MSLLSTSTARQRDSIIDYLKTVGNELNRLTSDRALNVCHLGARIKELKQLGWIFSTVRKPAYDLFGRLHPNIAHYTLKGFEASASEVQS